MAIFPLDLNKKLKSLIGFRKESVFDWRLNRIVVRILPRVNIFV